MNQLTYSVVKFMPLAIQALAELPPFEHPPSLPIKDTPAGTTPQEAGNASPEEAINNDASNSDKERSDLSQETVPTKPPSSNKDDIFFHDIMKMNKNYNLCIVHKGFLNGRIKYADASNLKVDNYELLNIMCDRQIYM